MHSTDMRLTHESLLPYQGFHGARGLCQIRVYEKPGRLPVVIAGALEDNPATSITNAIEMVAAAIQASVFTDGREFELIEYYPDSIDGASSLIFSRVRFAHRSIEEDPRDSSHYAGALLLNRWRSDAHRRGTPDRGGLPRPQLGADRGHRATCSDARSRSGSRAATRRAPSLASRGSGCATKSRRSRPRRWHACANCSNPNNEPMRLSLTGLWRFGSVW
jgi:hypothetical protein